MSYYTEDDEESKQLISSRRSRSGFLDTRGAKEGYHSLENDGRLDISDLEGGGNVINSHNVNLARRSKTLGGRRQEFDELNLNRSDDELSVISFEQVNQSHF